MLEDIPKWLRVSVAQEDKDTGSLTYLKLSPSILEKKLNTSLSFTWW